MLAVLCERFGAFALLGLLFSVSYPRRYGLVFGIVFGTAIALEFLQILIPDRHARILDAIEKLAGGGAGILSARWLLFVTPARIAQAFFTNPLHIGRNTVGPECKRD
jgi:VanZ family protein